MARQAWAEIQRGRDPYDTLPWLNNREKEAVRVVPSEGAFSVDHKLPGEAEMGEVYNRYDYLAEKRHALVKWCDHLSRLIRKGSRPRLHLVRAATGS